MRFPGFYWVRRFRGGQWEPAEWDGKEWYIIGDMPPVYDGDIAEIGEAIKHGDA